MSNYWEERMEQNLLNAEDKELEFEKTLILYYKKAVKDMKSTLSAFYEDYAEDGTINYKAQLNSSQLAELKETLKIYADTLNEYENTRLDSLLTKLDNMQNRVKVTRLQALIIEMECILAELLAKQEQKQTDVYGEAYIDSFENTVYNLQTYLGAGVSFTTPTKEFALQALKEKYLEESFSERVWKRKTMLLAILQKEITQGFVFGESSREVAERISTKMDVALSAAETLARTEMNSICNQSIIEAYKSQNVDKYQFLATLDDRTSEICRETDNKIFLVSEAKRGINYPPLHPRCYDKDTEVYTSTGWKFFKDLTDDDLIYTLNPITKIPEYEKPKQIISYLYEGDLIHFNHKYFDLCVTPNHECLVQYTGSNSNGQFRLVAAEKIGKTKNRFYRGCEWTGEEPTTMKLGQYDIDPELYCKFMAYYLADGSIKLTNRGYAVTIAQETHREKMFEELKALPVHVWSTATSKKIGFSDKSIWTYLKQFGKSPDKFIPQEIKNLSPRLIQIFLSAYEITDGTRRKGKVWKEAQFRDIVSYFTISNRLAGDLGELILKTGKRPCFHVQPNKDRPCFNGKWTSHYDLNVITEGHSVWSNIENIKRTLISYNDMVYCVELEKYHTLLVRRNGQVCWCGNCRSTTIPYLADNTTRKRLAKGEEGYYEVGDISYKEWKKLIEK